MIIFILKIKFYKIKKQEEISNRLKKTICGFLNSKGGSILIGVEDNTCTVKGIYLTSD